MTFHEEIFVSLEKLPPFYPLQAISNLHISRNYRVSSRQIDQNKWLLEATISDLAEYTQGSYIWEILELIFGPSLTSRYGDIEIIILSSRPDLTNTSDLWRVRSFFYEDISTKFQRHEIGHKMAIKIYFIQKQFMNIVKILE